MKYRFEIIYQNKYMKEACELMRKMDCDIGEAGFRETIILTSKNDKSISEIKELLKQAYQSADCILLHIEGGKVE